MNIKGQGHSLTFVQGHSDSTFSNFFSSKNTRQFSNIFYSATTGPIKVKFDLELLWDGGTKVCSNGLSHMTKMAPMPIYAKNF